MKHPTSKILYSYWNEVRRGRMAPRRFDIEPARVAGILAETTILEQVDADTYRFRLAGTRITEQFATELRGRNFLDLWDAEDRIGLQQNLTTLQQLGGAMVLDFEAATATGRTVAFEAVLLPLIHTRDAVDRFLGAISSATRPIWLGSETFETLTLTRNEIIWPDGRPHAIAQRINPQPPALNPDTAGARIVRLHRRQFRVLDGGLTLDERRDR